MSSAHSHLRGPNQHITPAADFHRVTSSRHFHNDPFRTTRPNGARRDVYGTVENISGIDWYFLDLSRFEQTAKASPCVA